MKSKILLLILLFLTSFFTYVYYLNFFYNEKNITITTYRKEKNTILTYINNVI